LNFRAGTVRAIVGLEVTDRAQAESGLAMMRTVAASVPEPFMAWSRLMYECGWALVEGDLQAAEQRAIQMFAVGNASGQPDAVLTFGAMLSPVRSFQGRAGELVEQIMQLAGEAGAPGGGWRAPAALVLIECGRADEARELALAEDFHCVPWEWAWSVVVCTWADVCSRLSLVDRSRELYELLVPFSGQRAVAGAFVMGSIARTLGELATTLERYEQAEGHFTAAAEIEERFGAPLFLARTRVDWARALIARGRSEDLDRAERMLEQADDAAGRLGATAVTRGVKECRAALAAISG
jgi:hypothetical protein